MAIAVQYRICCQGLDGGQGDLAYLTFRVMEETGGRRQVKWFSGPNFGEGEVRPTVASMSSLACMLLVNLE